MPLVENHKKRKLTKKSQPSRWNQPWLYMGGGTVHVFVCALLFAIRVTMLCTIFRCSTWWGSFTMIIIDHRIVSCYFCKIFFIFNCNRVHRWLLNHRCTLNMSINFGRCEYFNHGTSQSARYRLVHCADKQCDSKTHLRRKHKIRTLRWGQTALNFPPRLSDWTVRNGVPPIELHKVHEQVREKINCSYEFDWLLQPRLPIFRLSNCNALDYLSP